MVVTHSIVSDDVERSARFYTEVLGGMVVFGPEPTNIALANTFIIINVDGGSTDDKPTVTLETPRDPDRVGSFSNIRVSDIHAVYAEWSARGAEFLTPPKQHPSEIGCYMLRDPDGYIIEVGQTTDPQGDWVAIRLATDRPRRVVDSPRSLVVVYVRVRVDVVGPCADLGSDLARLARLLHLLLRDTLALVGLGAVRLSLLPKLLRLFAPFRLLAPAHRRHRGQHENDNYG
jgi:predicted enzyme related to lactoylglutathione lyase